MQDLGRWYSLPANSIWYSAFIISATKSHGIIQGVVPGTTRNGGPSNWEYLISTKVSPCFVHTCPREQVFDWTFGRKTGTMQGYSGGKAYLTGQCSVRNWKTISAYTVRVYVAVRTRALFFDFYGHPEHKRSSCRFRLEVHRSWWMLQHQEEMQLQSSDLSSMMGLLNKIRELNTYRYSQRRGYRSSKASEVFSREHKAFHLNLVFRSNEQGTVAIMRAMINLGVKKRIDLIVEIQSPSFEDMPHWGDRRHELVPLMRDDVSIHQLHWISPCNETSEWF